MTAPYSSKTVSSPLSNEYLEGYSLKGYHADHGTTLATILDDPLIDTYPDPDKNFIEKNSTMNINRKALDFRCAKSINHTRNEIPPKINFNLTVSSSVPVSFGRCVKEGDCTKIHVMCIDSYETKLRDDAVECYLEDICMNDVKVKTCVLKVHIVNIASVASPSSAVYRWFLRHCCAHYPIEGGKSIRTLVNQSERENISFNMNSPIPSLTLATRFRVVSSSNECVEIGEELRQYRCFYRDSVKATDFIPLQSDVLKCLLSDHNALEEAIREAGEKGYVSLETHRDNSYSVHVDAVRSLELLLKVVSNIKKSDIHPAPKNAVIQSASKDMSEIYRYIVPECFTSVRISTNLRAEKISDENWEKVGSVVSEVLSTRGSEKKHGLAECLDILQFYDHCATQFIREKCASECMILKTSLPPADKDILIKMSAYLEALFLKSGSDLWSQPDESKLTSQEHLLIRKLEITHYSRLVFQESRMYCRKRSHLIGLIRVTNGMMAAFDKNCIIISFTHPCRDFIDLYHQRLLQYCCGVDGDEDCSLWPEKLSDSLLVKVSNRYALLDLCERTAAASIVEGVLLSAKKTESLLVPAYYVDDSGSKVVISCFGDGRVFNLIKSRISDVAVPKVLTGAPCTVALISAKGKGSESKKLVATLYSHPFHASHHHDELTESDATKNDLKRQKEHEDDEDCSMPVKHGSTKESNEELFLPS